MQIEEYLYQKNLYQSLGGKEKKPTMMSNANWEVLESKSLGTIQLSRSSLITFNISEEKITTDLMVSL